MNADDRDYWLHEWRRYVVGDGPHPEIPIEIVEGDTHEDDDSI